MSCLFMSLFWLMVLDLFWLGVVGCRMIGAGLVLLVLAGGVGLVWLCGVFVWPGRGSGARVLRVLGLWLGWAWFSCFLGFMDWSAALVWCGVWFVFVWRV